MLLAIDVGNTNIVLGVFEGRELIRSWRLQTLRDRTADELGLGPAFSGHGCLDMVLQEMTREGGYSPALVAAGLRSPVVRNRNMGVLVQREMELAGAGVCKPRDHCSDSAFTGSSSLFRDAGVSVGSSMLSRAHRSRAAS